MPLPFAQVPQLPTIITKRLCPRSNTSWVERLILRQVIIDCGRLANRVRVQFNFLLIGQLRHPCWLDERMSCVILCQRAFPCDAAIGRSQQLLVFILVV